MVGKHITENSEILAHITIKLADDSVADSTKVNREPQRIRLNSNDVSPAFAKALLGHKLGETVSFILAPEDAFGQPNPLNFQTLPRSRFDAKIALSVGTIVEFEKLNGPSLAGIIRELNEDEVRVDFNHPLCGQTLTFEVDILAIDPPAGYQVV